jgi:hypothetical protein
MCKVTQEVLVKREKELGLEPWGTVYSVDE